MHLLASGPGVPRAAAWLQGIPRGTASPAPLPDQSLRRLVLLALQLCPSVRSTGLPLEPSSELSGDPISPEKALPKNEATGSSW